MKIARAERAKLICSLNMHNLRRFRFPIVLYRSRSHRRRPLWRYIYDKIQ